MTGQGPGGYATMADARERAGIGGALAGLARAPVPRDLTAWLGALAVFVLSDQGLFQLWWTQQPAALAGVVAGLLGTGWWQAAASAVAAVVIGTLLQAPRLFGTTVMPGSGAWWWHVSTMVLWSGGSAALVSLARSGLERRRPGAMTSRRYEIAVVVLVAAVIVANMWASAWLHQSVKAYGGRSVAARISQRPTPGTKMQDDDFYRDVLWLMRVRHLPYYDAFRQAYRDNAYWGGLPPFFLSYRLPTTYWLLSSLPGAGTGIVIAAMLGAAVAVASATVLAARRVRPALALVAAAATASLFVDVTSRLFVLYSEAWAAPLAVAAVALHETARMSKRWRAFTVAAVAVAVAAALFREIAAFVIVAALAASVVAPRDKRRFLLTAWGCGLGVVAAAVLAHYLAVGGATNGEGAGWLFGPSLANPAAGLSFGVGYLADGMWLVALLAALGLAGAASAPDNQSKVFLLTAVLLPLIAFSLLYNGGIGVHGERINYWGVLVSPILYGLVPWAFAVLPGSGQVATTKIGKEGTGDE